MGESILTVKMLLDYTKKELLRMTKGYSPPIAVKPSWTKSQIAEAICIRDKAEKQKQPEAPEQKQPAEQPTEQPVNPDFEAAVGSVEIPKDARGGARPGAGRPPGMSDVKAKVKNLPQQPNQSVKAAIEFFFNMWAERTKVPDVALTEKQSASLSLPATQLIEYYGVGIPEIAWTWFMMLAGVADVTYAKISLIREAQKIKKPVDSKEVDNAGTPGQQNNNRQDGQREDGQGPKTN